MISILDSRSDNKVHFAEFYYLLDLRLNQEREYKPIDAVPLPRRGCFMSSSSEGESA